MADDFAFRYLIWLIRWQHRGVIDTTDAPSPLEEDGLEEGSRLTFGSILARGLVAVLGIGSFGIWVYAYSGLAANDREYTDQLDVGDFAESAEPICFAAKSLMSDLPYSISAADAAERSDQILEADAVLNNMLTQLRAIDLTTQTERDQGMLAKWLDEYDIFVADRDRYAAKLLVEPEAVMTFTDIGTGRIERRLTWFADVNEMDSCITPTDVG